MGSDGAGERDMGRRKGRRARSKYISISEIPTDPVKSEQIYEARDSCSREG
jgi:hypothetical protein